MGKVSLIGSKYCYISKNHVSWPMFLQQSICLEKGTCQGDPISGYLFICTVETIFLLIKIIPQ